MPWASRFCQASLKSTLEIDFLAAFRSGAGTWSKEIAFLVIPGGSSELSQPLKVKLSANAVKIRENVFPALLVSVPVRLGISVIIGHQFPPCSRAEGLVDLVIHLVTQVTDMAVTVGEV